MSQLRWRGRHRVICNFRRGLSIHLLLCLCLTEDNVLSGRSGACYNVLELLLRIAWEAGGFEHGCAASRDLIDGVFGHKGLPLAEHDTLAVSRTIESPHTGIPLCPHWIVKTLVYQLIVQVMCILAGSRCVFHICSIISS